MVAAGAISVVIAGLSLRRKRGRRSTVTLLAVILALMWMPLLAIAADARITVSVDRDDIRAGENFVLTFDAQGADGRPDFSALEQDFDILGSSQRTNLTMMDGRFAKSTVWQLNLMPKHAGEIEIPAIRFGEDASAPLTITVAQAGPGAEQANSGLFFEVETDITEPYVQAQVLLRVRLYVPHEVDLVDARFDDPRASGGDALITAIGKTREGDETRNGRDYRVVERLYAVFPQQHGALTIEPIAFEGQVFVGAGSLLNPFSQSIRTYRLESDAVSLQVKPIPAAFTGDHWLPAQQLTLNDTWSDDDQTLRVGEPVTRTLSLLANGLTAGQLPEIASALPPEVKSYPETPVLDDQARSEGVSGLRVEKLTLLSSEDGSFAVPEIRVPWWNTETDRSEEIVLPARTFRVEGATTPSPPQTATSPPAADAAKATPAPPPLLGTDGRAWQIAAAVLALGWLLTVWLWWRSARRLSPRRATSGAGNEAGKRARAVLGRSRRHDARATYENLLAWARASGIEPATLEEIGRRHAPLAAPCADLTHSLYSRAAPPWNGDVLARAFAAAARTPVSSPTSPPPSSALTPLYP